MHLVSGASSAYFTGFQNGGRPPVEVRMREIVEFTGYNVSMDVALSRNPNVKVHLTKGGKMYVHDFGNAGARAIHPNYNYVATGYITGVNHYVMAYFRFGQQWFGPVIAFKNQSTWH